MIYHYPDSFLYNIFMPSDPLQSSKYLHMPQQILYNEREGYRSPSTLQTSTNFGNQKLRDV